MKIVSRIGIGLGAIVLGAVLIALSAPKAVNALVATLVQVANTSANPVPNKDVDNPGRNAFSSECSSFGGGNTTGCLLTTVASGNELVIQGLTVKIVTDLGASTETTLTASVNGTYHSYNIGVQDQGPCSICGGGAQHIYTGGLAFPIYADPGTSVFINSTNDSFPPDGIILDATASGYRVSIP